MAGTVKGYTQFFVKTNSIASEERNRYGIYEWSNQTYEKLVGSRAIQNDSIVNSMIAPGAIGTDSIGTITFNQITGGTADIGGSANIGGVITVFNSIGVQMGRWDNGGLEAYNTSGSLIMNGSGLAIDNFPSSTYFNNTPISTGSTSFIDVSGGSLSIGLPKSAKVLISFSGDVVFGGTSPTSEYGASLRISIGGTAQDPTLRGSLIHGGSLGTAGFTMHQTLSHSGVYSLSAGTQTVQLQWASSLGTASLSAKNLSYAVLGV